MQGMMGRPHLSLMHPRCLSFPQMEPLIADSVSRLLAKFQKAADSGTSVDVSEYFGRFTIEVILASAFGRHKDIQSTEERNKLTDALATALGSINESSMLDGALLKRWLCEWACMHCDCPGECQPSIHCQVCVHGILQVFDFNHF